MISSEPSLPKEIRPAATETLYFLFPRDRHGYVENIDSGI
jgi:hypothetical protein